MSVTTHDRDLRLGALQHLRDHLSAHVPTRLQVASPQLAFSLPTPLSRQMAALPVLLVGTPHCRVRVVHARENPQQWFYLWPSIDLVPEQDCLYPLDNAASLIDQIGMWWAEMTTVLTESEHPRPQRTDADVAQLWAAAFPHRVEQDSEAPGDGASTGARLDLSQVDIGAS